MSNMDQNVYCRPLKGRNSPPETQDVYLRARRMCQAVRLQPFEASDMREPFVLASPYEHPRQHLGPPSNRLLRAPLPLLKPVSVTPWLAFSSERRVSSPG